VRVKFDALPFQWHDTIDGQVRVITENSFRPDKGAAGAKECRRPSDSFVAVADGAKEATEASRAGEPRTLIKSEPNCW
jgi:hypothetical protein